MVYRKCPSCGANKFVEDGKFLVCKYCGTTIKNPKFEDEDTKIKEAQKQSKETNAEAEQTNPDINKQIEKVTSAAKSAKSSKLLWSVIQLIVCILFGYMGAHKFMTGKIFTGLLYLFTLVCLELDILLILSL